jgi:hypothetical protein
MEEYNTINIWQKYKLPDSDQNNPELVKGCGIMTTW